jgi:uncharacterized protein
MTQLSPEMIEAFKATRYFPFATASRDGDPNVAPMGSVFLIDPETIWIGNQYMKATIKNVRENPRATLLVWGAGIPGCLKIKGNITVADAGPDYEKMKEMVKARKPDLQCKALLIMKVTEVFDCRSGKEAGKKLV